MKNIGPQYIMSGNYAGAVPLAPRLIPRNMGRSKYGPFVQSKGGNRVIPEHKELSRRDMIHRDGGKSNYKELNNTISL